MLKDSFIKKEKMSTTAFIYCPACGAMLSGCQCRECGTILMSYSEMTSEAYKTHDRIDTMWIVPKHITEMDIPSDFSTKALIGEEFSEILKEQEREEETGDSDV